MTCSYGPYKITSKLEAVGEFIFIDNELSRRVAVFSDCAETVSPPCSGAVALHIEDDCPDGCKIYWYECPSEMGRQYTILPTPCGVKVTSFEDGLITVNNCDATLFGSELFCFGKIYTSLGEFDSPDKSLTTFEFDGHTFTVKGELGACNELYSCPECQTSSEIVTFAELPTPPESISAPAPLIADEVISDTDTPQTTVIPTEGRVRWHWTTDPATFGTDTLCEDEKSLTTTLPVCSSNDNPAMATLPSGHTVVAYENRGEDGIAKISVVILASSVGENVRSHRKLGTGTLLNNLAESEGVATFIVYEEMNIIIDGTSNEKIGFLTGPLAGKLFQIMELTRFRDGDTIRHELNFIVPNGSDVEFPDKNNIYDVNWFIIGGADLLSSTSVAEILDLPFHTDGEGNAVPVANSSIAVAQNNQMISNEQNIYVAYQAFVDDQWRVYLREIVLGGASEVSPTYLAPYLFENEQKVSIMSSPLVTAMAATPDFTFYEEDFSRIGVGVGSPVDMTDRWRSYTSSDIPAWRWENWWGNDEIYLTKPFILTNATGPLGATGLPSVGCTGGVPTCAVAFNSRFGTDLGDDSSSSIVGHTRSFAISLIPTTIPAATSPTGSSFNTTNLSFRMRFHIIINNTFSPGPSSDGLEEYPEIWFLIGKSTSGTSSFAEGYRIQIRRGRRLDYSSMGIDGVYLQRDLFKCSPIGNRCVRYGGGFDGCFIFALYKDTSPIIEDTFSWDERNIANGSQTDQPVRVIWRCVHSDDWGNAGDYSLLDWNEWRIDTYIRGFYRVFDIYLTHPDGTEVLMTRFREWEESIPPQSSADSLYSLGPYHGFGVVQSDMNGTWITKHQVLIDSFSAKTIPPDTESDKIYFLEDYLVNHYVSDPVDTIISNTSPFMNSEPILTNSDYEGRHLIHATSPWGNTFYPWRGMHYFGRTNIGQATLSFPALPTKGWATYLRILPSAVDRTPTGEGISHQDSVSVVVSANRSPDPTLRAHEGAYPHIWVAARLPLINSPWYSRYRLRISRFDAVSDYPDVGPGIDQNDKVWRFSVYNSGTGLSTDTPQDEHFLIIGPDTNLDWTEWSSTVIEPFPSATWNYFKIDITVVVFQIVFNIYIGSVSEDRTYDHDESGGILDNYDAGVPQDMINFSLLDTISVSRIFDGLDGPFFGVGLFSGSIDESSEGLTSEGVGDDYRTVSFLNYISLSTLGGPPTLGACCRERGSCDEGVHSLSCLSLDIWKSGQTCEEADCGTIFPVGAGCTPDGICHDGITEPEAIRQGIGLCTDCEWLVDTDCNGGGTDRGCPEAIDKGRCCRPFQNPPGTADCVDNITFAECQVYYGGSDTASGFSLGETCASGCPSPITDGACCLPSGCYITKSEVCIAQGGTFFDAHDCVSINISCSTEGACCGVESVLNEDCQPIAQPSQFLTDREGPAYWGNAFTMLRDSVLTDFEIELTLFDDPTPLHFSIYRANTPAGTPYGFRVWDPIFIGAPIDASPVGGAGAEEPAFYAAELPDPITLYADFDYVLAVAWGPEIVELHNDQDDTTYPKSLEGDGGTTLGVTVQSSPTLPLDSETTLSATVFDFYALSMNLCLDPQVFVLAEGGCTELPKLPCDTAGGTFLGIGVSCTPDPCSYIGLGACCYDDGGCTDTIESACVDENWLYSALCSESPCPVIFGACCDPFTGECEDEVSKNDCQNVMKTFLGEGSSCSNVNCAQPIGACCVDFNCIGGKTLQECTDLGGRHLGSLTNCIEDICLDDLEDPYLANVINYKPEDLWIIETSSEQYITRVLYHMQGETTISSLQIGDQQEGTNTVDFMFLIDYIDETYLPRIIAAVPDLVDSVLSKGLDVRFGFTFFGRGIDGIPIPSNSVFCGCGQGTFMADGLQETTRCKDGNPDNLEGEPTAVGGFTRNVNYLQRALGCWESSFGWKSPWTAIQFAIEDPRFDWRENAAKFIFLVMEEEGEECPSCESWSNSEVDATNSLIDNNVVLIPIVDRDENFADAISEASGWGGGSLDITEDDYRDLFERVTATIDLLLRVNNVAIIERATSGTAATHLKKSEVIITYDGDLSDLWTFNKTDFEFQDSHVPFPGTNVKQLVNFPFPLASGKIYGIDSVHIQGNPDNWVFFEKEGALIYDHPAVGLRESKTSDTPLLISTNSVRPKVYVNNRNQVMVAYENQTSGTPQIEIKGTGDFHQNSITGPKANRIVRLLNQNDFAYRHTITLPGEGVNQLCDFVIDNSDITHVVWQSSRDGYWEIYYGNSFNLFDPVRITKVESRSSHPSIDVDETGSIFVVYHDNRFGAFNIMLSSKDEERVIPLLEQDAYLASLRTGYTHYTNIIPVFLDNPSTTIPANEQLWASKKEDGAGNDSENFVYKINQTTGIPSDGFELVSPGQKAVAFSSTAFWGITSDGILTRLGNIIENEVILAPAVVGTVDITPSRTILDMAVDKFDRIWVLIWDQSNSLFELTFEYVSGFDASTLASGNIRRESFLTGASLAITSDNTFYITWTDLSSDIFLATSFYPDIVNQVATFSFRDTGALTPSITPVSLTSDSSNNLFAVSTDNDLYTISKSSAATTLQTSLTTGSGDDSVLPIGSTSSIAYQLSGVEIIGESKHFHVRIDFYDNISFEGDVFLSVDSRENLEAFINQETLQDPYAASGMNARGILLELDQTGIVFFDVSNFVPGFSRLSQPYSFEPNQTYFPRVFLIDDTDNARESGLAQSNSFSCTKCSRFGNNNFNTNACSYSFVTTNSDNVEQFFNFQIDFYADTGKRHLLRRFEVVPNGDDLQYIEVDNIPGIDQWGEFGLSIAAGESAFVQVYPVLDPTAGFLCGITYTVEVKTNTNIGDFLISASSDWFSLPVGGESTETINDQHNEAIPGLSMKLISNKLCIAWRTSDNNLKFAQYDDDQWTSEFVLTGPQTIYCDLSEINGLPSISHVMLKEGDENTSLTEVLSLEDGSWNDWPNMKETRSSHLRPALFNPRSLLEHDNAPMVVAAGSSLSLSFTSGKPFYRLNDGVWEIWDLNLACFPPYGSSEGGSCTITLVNINGSPAVAWIGSSQVRYATWETVPSTGRETFFNDQIISGDVPIPGKIGLAEIDGQPAIVYIKAVGDLGELKYKRYNGTDWVDTPTNGQIQDFNKHVAITVINGQPYIAYSIKTSSTTSQLRYVFHNGTEFVDGLVEDGLGGTDHLVDIIEFNNKPAIVISANPFRVYFFRQLPSQLVSEVRPIFFCECSSKIFTDRLTQLNEVARWESSAHGFADTSVTDSQKNSLRPTMRTRKTKAAIIIWEDYNESNNCTDPPCIRAATFRNVNQDQLRGSGTGSWFDYDFGISGQDSDLTLDLFERVNSVYEKPKPSSVEGFHGQQLSANELPGNELYGKVCDFSIAEETSDPDNRGCDISALENNVISFDQFISSQIVRKILVKDEFVQYHTYNASGILTPIVSTCNISLEIHGTPEIVALRFRNENEVVWGLWCPWSPQISDFVMEKDHQISGGSGVKEICIQAMTYIGITTEFCIPVVADYETIIFETKFYRNTDIEGVEITNFSDVTNGFFPVNLDEKLIELPLSDGISVASLDLKGGGTPCPGGSECEENEICINGRCVVKTATILVEIVPTKTDEPQINFDIIQQGTNDQRGQPANKGKNNVGRVLYRGEFTIKREDKVFNTDGLARISPTFPSACEGTDNQIVGASDMYTRDIFNEIGEDITVEETEVIDPLIDFRQTTSGRVGVSLDIRSSEDPYFVFGNPDYSLKKTDGQRLGVPFLISETDIEIGKDPDQTGNTCERNRPPGGCPKVLAPNGQLVQTSWIGWPVCACVRPGG